MVEGRRESRRGTVAKGRRETGTSTKCTLLDSRVQGPGIGGVDVGGVPLGPERGVVSLGGFVGLVVTAVLYSTITVQSDQLFLGIAVSSETTRKNDPSSLATRPFAIMIITDACMQT